MSFNLNKLVQPECGAPNPLVAAAQQIAMKPSAGISAGSRLQQHQYRQIRPQLNFAQEFSNQRELPKLTSKLANITQSLSSVAASAAAASTSAITLSATARQQQEQYNNMLRQSMGNPMMNYMTMMAPDSYGHQHQHHQHHHHPSIQSNHLHCRQQDLQQESISQLPGALAGEQLETKYRNDMISQASSSSAFNLKDITDNGKLDDVEFWQSLSQQYLGPPTFNNIARLRAERAARLEADQADPTSNISQQELIDKFDNLTTEEQIKFDDSIDELHVGEPFDATFPQLNDLEYVFDERNPLKDQFEDPFSEAMKRLEQGDIPSAALLFEAAVQKEPENSVAWRYLGTTQAQNEKDMSAIRALRNCLNLNKDDQEARLAIAVSLVNETQHHEACKYLLEWLMNNERYASVQANLKEFHLLDNELSNDPFYVNSIADRHYNYVRDKFMAAARMSPRDPDPEVQNSLGVLFNMSGEYDKAVDCFKAALSVRSNDTLLWNRLGATLANGSKSEEAVIAYRRALEISPGFLRSRYNLAISLIHLNLYEEAAKQLVQILNTQAAGKGSKNAQIRTRSITSTSIWNALRTVATLLNQPNLYPIIDGRDLAKCNEQIFGLQAANGSYGDTSILSTSSPSSSSPSAPPATSAPATTGATTADAN